MSSLAKRRRKEEDEGGRKEMGRIRMKKTATYRTRGSPEGQRKNDQIGFIVTRSVILKHLRVRLFVRPTV